MLYTSIMLLICFLVLAVIVEFTQTNLTVDEGEGVVDVCISVDMPTATPISFFIEAVESSPISAIGLLICINLVE